MPFVALLITRSGRSKCYHRTPQLPLTVISIAAVLIFIGFYASSWGNVVWVVATELVPLRYASRGSSRQLSASPEPLLTRA